MRQGHRGRHRRRRRAVGIALAIVLGAALAAWVGGSLVNAMQLSDFTWTLDLLR